MRFRCSTRSPWACHKRCIRCITACTTKANNDRRDPITGTTIDLTSSYRYAKVANEEEGILAYSLKGPVRSEIMPLIHEGVRRGRTRQIVLEFIALGLLWLVIAMLSWQNFVFFYLPMWFLGQVLNYAEGYLLHYGRDQHQYAEQRGQLLQRRVQPAVVQQRLPTRSITIGRGCIGHGCQRCAAKMLDESQRVIVPYCHVANLPALRKRGLRSVP